MGDKGWREIADDGDAWRLILEDARVLHGRYSQWRQRERKVADIIFLWNIRRVILMNHDISDTVSTFFFFFFLQEKH
jgi:hypothetical protein